MDSSLYFNSTKATDSDMELSEVSSLQMLSSDCQGQDSYDLSKDVHMELIHDTTLAWQSFDRESWSWEDNFEKMMSIKEKYNEFASIWFTRSKNPYFEKLETIKEEQSEEELRSERKDIFGELITSCTSICRDYACDLKKTEIKEEIKSQNRRDYVFHKFFQFIIKFPFYFVEQTLEQKERELFKKLISTKCFREPQDISEEDEDFNFRNKMDPEKISQMLELIEQAFFSFIMFFRVERDYREYRILFTQFFILVLKDQGRRTRLVNSERWVTEILNSSTVTNVFDSPYKLDLCLKEAKIHSDL